MAVPDDRIDSPRAAPAPISFGFSRRKEVRAIQGNGEEISLGEGTDYVLSLEGNNVRSVKPKEEKKALVIPLIKKNQWRKSDSIASLPEREADSLESAAVKEIIEDARRREGEEDGEASIAANLAIPLLMQNKVPDGFETDSRLDVSLRPEEPAEADYDQVPIEEYGLAMLRGMGWKQGEGIGKNKHLTKPIEAVLRPKGMGLGADRSALLQDQHEKAGSRGPKGRKPGEAKGDEEELLDFRKGIHCVVTRGPHTDLYGTIEGVDEDNCRCMVKLALSSQSVSISQYALKLVAKTEFEKFSKYLNKRKSDQYKEAEKEKSSLSDRKQHSEKSPADNSRSQTTASMKRKYESGVKEPHGKHGSSTVAACGLWLRQLLRVRIVDKKYKNGMHYNAKVIVEDVPSADSAVCRTEDGRVLDDVCQSMVETVVPKDGSSLVMVVSGKSRGQLGEIIKRDKSKCRATVQLLADREQVLNLSYDDICEWTGDTSQAHDY